ncbi:acyl-CoA dehydrogenase family protein [Labrys wisconsinensis]|nr:acyl-CoA dehydrogenase [Labrys wisconsinensis]
MQFALSQEHEMLVETVRRFVEEELYPHEDLVEATDEIPDDLARRIRAKAIELGLYAANMPGEVGGGGLDALGLALLERELGRANYALQMLVARPSNILQGCSDEQRERYLLPTVRGERHDCLAMTEPGAGSDVRSMKTRAVRQGDDYVINGQKHFISHADRADFIILFAVTGTEETRRGPRNQISGFLVDKGTPGLTVRRGPNAVSHRGYHNCELFFDDCKLPASQLLGREGRGFDLMNEWLGATRLTVAATSIGRARRVMEATLEWAGQRRQFGQTISQFQGVSFPLADLMVELEAAELLTLRAAWLLDQGRASDADFAMAKLAASEMLGKLTDRAVQTFGGMGLMDSLPIARWWKDARVERIWDGTSEIQRLIIARQLLRPHEAKTR